MKSRYMVILMIFAILVAFIPLTAGASGPYGIWLQGARTGGQSWAYYPFDLIHPWSGGKWSAKDTGTSNFVVVPGTTIARKIIVHCNLPPLETVYIKVTGLPSSWVVKVNPTKLVNGQSIKNGLGYSSFYVTVPANAAAGSYGYSITATSGNGSTSTITDSIVIGNTGATNFLLNPGFENGMANWVNSSMGGVEAVSISNDSHSGLRSIHLYCGDGGPAYSQHRPYAAVYQPINVQQSNNITLSFWSKGSAFTMLFGTIDDPLGPWPAVSVPGSAGWTYHTINWSYNNYPAMDYFQYGIMPYVSENSDVYIDDMTATITS